MRNVDSTWNIIDLLERLADCYGVHIRTAQRWINEIDERRGLVRIATSSGTLWRMFRCARKG